MSGGRPLYAALAGFGIVGGLYFAARSGTTTPAVRSLEDRFSAAGGSKDHTPGSASPLGKPELIEGAHGVQGKGSFEFNQQVKEQQAGHAVVTRTRPPAEQNKTGSKS